jgi:orotate phosphoribosyltransferase
VFFRSMDDLHRDVVAWSAELPADIDVVVGIPRSGLLAASLLALHRQVLVADLDGLLVGRHLGGGRRLGQQGEALTIASARRILVVDDSVYSGAAMRAARAAVAGSGLTPPVDFGAVYATRGATHHVDHFFAVVPQPRVFAWNVLHHECLTESCMDIDGVLCRDPSDVENDDGPRYREFLETVPVRYVPSVEVGCLVTSRLERYRPETEAWLARAGVRYRRLVMHPATSGAERRAAGDHGERKAKAYLDTAAPLFVESDLAQAVTIAGISGRPVYCTDAAQMVYPGSTVEQLAAPTVGRSLAWQARHELRLKVKAVRRRLAPADGARVDVRDDDRAALRR